MAQLNEYETVSYFTQSNQKWPLDCFLISVLLLVFVWCDHNIVLQIKRKQFYDRIMQKLEKNTEINKQSDVAFWLNCLKFGAVSYLLSCTTIFDLSFWHRKHNNGAKLMILVMAFEESRFFVFWHLFASLTLECRSLAKEVLIYSGLLHHYSTVVKKNLLPMPKANGLIVWTKQKHVLVSLNE